MSSTVTTATMAAITSSISSLPAATIGIVALLLLLTFLVEKEVLLGTGRPELVIAARYINVVIVPLLLAFGLIAAFRLGLATGLLP